MSTRSAPRSKPTSKPAAEPKESKLPKSSGNKPVSGTAATPAEHPTYKDMITSAVIALKDRKGSSRQAIKKYISSNYKVGESAGSHINAAIKRGVKEGTFLQPKGSSGPVKLGNKEPTTSKTKPVSSKGLKPSTNQNAKEDSTGDSPKKKKAIKKTKMEKKPEALKKKATGKESTTAKKQKTIKKATAVKNGTTIKKAKTVKKKAAKKAPSKAKPMTA